MRKHSDWLFSSRDVATYFKQITEALKRIEDKFDALEIGISAINNVCDIQSSMFNLMPDFYKGKSADDIARFIQAETDSDKLKEIIIKALKNKEG